MRLLILEFIRIEKNLVMKNILYALTALTLVLGCSKTESPLETMESRFSDARYEQAIIACDVVLQNSTDKDVLHRSRIVKGQSYMALAAQSLESKRQEDADRLARLAIDEFTKALEINEDDFDAYYRRSDAYRLIGNESECMKDAQAARERDPAYSIAYTNELRRKTIDLRDIDRTIAQVSGDDEPLESRSDERRDAFDESTEDDESENDEETVVSLKTPIEKIDGDKQIQGTTPKPVSGQRSISDSQLAVSNQNLKTKNIKTEAKTNPSESESKSDKSDGKKDEPESMEEEQPNSTRRIFAQPTIPRTSWDPVVRQPISTQPAPRPQPTTGFVNNASRAHNPFPNYPTTGYNAPSPTTTPTQPTVPPSNGVRSKTSFGLGAVVTQNLPNGSMQFTGAMPFKHRPALGGSSDKQAYLTPAQPLTNNKVQPFTPTVVKPIEPSTLWKRPPVYFAP